MDAIQPMLRSQKIAQLNEISGVSKSTISNWKKKKVRRPQFCTISAVALAVGASGIDFVDGVPQFRLEPRKQLKVVK
jgi:transcriptional regulator with XRE-family HTH domain